jgi:hypothetical protein
MARITRVRAAQQRYETIPVLDTATMKPKRTQVMRKDGTPKLTKGGREIWRTVTVEDRARPLLPDGCDHCRKPIAIGTPYKHITPRSGPYSGYRRSRHASCPDWQPWDYSSSLNARLAQVSHEFSQSLAQCETEDDVQGALDEAACSVREIADEKRESAENMKEGFGHETSQSDELEETADQLESWAGEIESAAIPDFPEAEEEECEACSGTAETECGNCGGTGTLQGADEDVERSCDACNGDSTIPCEDCEGNGHTQADEPTADQVGEWRDECADSLTIVDEIPV